MLKRNIFLVLWFLYLTYAAHLKFEWEIDWIDVNPDGHPRKAIGINGQFMGPTIEAEYGDLLSIRICNRLPTSFSIHWHGILQKGTPDQDGAAFITECPIQKGYCRVYEYYVNQLGTYWYHSHFMNEYVDGAKGALIVRRNKHQGPDPYPCKNEIILDLTDWYHKLADDIWNKMEHTVNGRPPLPDSVLIDGIGQTPECIKRGDCRYPVFNVPAGSPVCIRAVNTGAYQPIVVSIDDHYLEIVEVDGVEVKQTLEPNYKPTGGIANNKITHVRINVAQRYTFLAYPLEYNTAKEGDTFWIRAVIEKDASPPPKSGNKTNDGGHAHSRRRGFYEDEDDYHRDDDYHHREHNSHHHHREDDDYNRDDDFHHRDDDEYHRDDDYHHREDEDHHGDDDEHHRDDDEYHRDDDEYHRDDEDHHGDDDEDHHKDHHREDEDHHGDDDEDHHKDHDHKDDGYGVDLAVAKTTPDNSNVVSLGVLVYGDSKIDSLPTTKDHPELLQLSSRNCEVCVACSILYPLEELNPPETDIFVTLNIDFFPDKKGISHAHFNNKTCVLDNMHSTYISHVRAKEPLPINCPTYVLRIGDYVTFVFNNHGGGEHPIHLHGYVFWVLAQGLTGSGDFDLKKVKLDYKNPLRRDTATVNPSSYVVVSFVVDNWGLWIMHCHINWHMMEGLGIIVVAGEDEIIKNMGSRQSHEECKVDMNGMEVVPEATK